MKAQHIIGVWIVWLALVQIAFGQAFVNLDLEQATIAPTPVGQFGPLHADPAQAFRDGRWGRVGQ